MSVRRQDAGFGRPVRYRLPPFRVAAAYTQLSETTDWGLALLHVPEQWRATQGAGVRVALLDTGLEHTHADLLGAVDDLRDFTGSRSGTLDRVGHGTHTAGIVGARRNDRGVVGVAPECRLLIGKVLGDDGSGPDDAVAAGIDWAVAAGADVISLSLGAPTPSPAIAAAVSRAVAAGKFLICAAGNDGQSNSVNYPARFDDTVAVGAVNRNGRIAEFSSRGPEVDVCAPGEDILSTYLGGGYARLSGTSMAAPFVSGVVALLLAKHKQAGGATVVETPRQLIEHLQRTATDAGPKFPGFENLVVTELTVEPFDPESPDAQPELLLERAANTYRGGARVTATYQTLYDSYTRLRPDLPKVPDSTFLIYRGDLGAETVRTPGRLWRYAIDDAPPVDDDVNPGLLIPTGNVQLTWLRVPSPPWNAQRLLRGKVNGSTFLSAPAGTLLFLGVRAVREFQLLDDDALWRIDYHFAEQTKPLAGGGFGGWNHFYREEADDGEHWLAIADADGNPPYAAGDFSALFQFE